MQLPLRACQPEIETPMRNPMHHIYRTPGGHGWHLKVMREGKTEECIFQDKDYNDHPGHALTAAVDYRDEHYPELASGQGTAAHGLGIHLKRTRVGDKVYLSFGAHWTDEAGERHTSYFAVKRYGFEEALRRACQARFDAVGERSYYGSVDELYEAAREQYEALQEELDQEVGSGE